MGLGRVPVKYVRRLPARLSKSQNRVVQQAYGVARTVVRRLVNAVTPLQLGWVGTLQAARWRQGTFLLWWSSASVHGDTPVVGCDTAL